MIKSRYLWNKTLYQLFDAIVTNLSNASNQFLQFLLSKGYFLIEANRQEMYELEQEGDILTHDLGNCIATSSIMPERRKDIYMLAFRLDDVIDFIWKAVDKLYIYKLKPMKETVRISKDLIVMSRVLSLAVKSLNQKAHKDLLDYCMEIKKQEKRLRAIFREAYSKIFEEFTDSILVIKWNDVYGHLQDASRTYKDLAKIMEEISLKYNKM